MLQSCLLSTQKSQHFAILDSGAKDHHLLQNTNTTNISQNGYIPITVTLPNGNTLTSTQKCKLPISNIDAKALNGHVIPSSNNSLISIEKFFDTNYTAVFTNKDVKFANHL